MVTNKYLQQAYLSSRTDREEFNPLRLLIALEMPAIIFILITSLLIGVGGGFMPYLQQKMILAAIKNDNTEGYKFLGGIIGFLILRLLLNTYITRLTHAVALNFQVYIENGYVTSLFSEESCRETTTKKRLFVFEFLPLRQAIAGLPVFVEALAKLITTSAVIAGVIGDWGLLTLIGTFVSLILMTILQTISHKVTKTLSEKTAKRLFLTEFSFPFLMQLNQDESLSTQIDSVRKDECNTLFIELLLHGACQLIFDITMFVPIVVWCYKSNEGFLSPQMVFVGVTMVNSMNSSRKLVVHVSNWFVQARTALNRLIKLVSMQDSTAAIEKIHHQHRYCQDSFSCLEKDVEIAAQAAELNLFAELGDNVNSTISQKPLLNSIEMAHKGGTISSQPMIKQTMSEINEIPNPNSLEIGGVSPVQNLNNSDVGLLYQQPNSQMIKSSASELMKATSAISSTQIVMILCKSESQAKLEQYLLNLYADIKDEPISLITQDPFILPTTTKDNVVFNQPFQQARYSNAISSTGLHMAEQLLNGDNKPLHTEYCKLKKWFSLKLELSRFLNSKTCRHALIRNKLFLSDQTFLKSIIRACRALKKQVFIVNTSFNFLPLAERLVYLAPSGEEYLLTWNKEKTELKVDKTGQRVSIDESLNITFLTPGKTLMKARRISSIMSIKGQYKQQPFLQEYDSLTSCNARLFDMTLVLKEIIKTSLPHLILRNSISDVRASTGQAKVRRYLSQDHDLDEAANTQKYSVINYKRFFNSYFNGAYLLALFLIAAPTSLKVGIIVAISQFPAAGTTNTVLILTVLMIFGSLMKWIFLSHLFSQCSYKLYHGLITSLKKSKAPELVRILKTKSMHNLQMHLESLDRNLMKEFQLSFTTIIEQQLSFILMLVSKVISLLIALPVMIFSLVVVIFYANVSRRFMLFNEDIRSHLVKFLSILNSQRIKVRLAKKQKWLFNEFSRISQYLIVLDCNHQWMVIGLQAVGQVFFIAAYIGFAIAMLEATSTDWTSLMGLSLSIVFSSINILKQRLKSVRAASSQGCSMAELYAIEDSLKVEMMPEQQKEIDRFQRIDFKDLSIQTDVKCCQFVSFTLKRGQRVVISGPNSGKEYLLYELRKVFQPNQVTGTILINNYQYRSCRLKGIFEMGASAVMPVRNHVWQILSTFQPDLDQDAIGDKIATFWREMDVAPQFQCNTLIESLRRPALQLLQLIRVVYFQSIQVLLINNPFTTLDGNMRMRAVNLLLKSPIPIIIEVTDQIDVFQMYPRHITMQSGMVVSDIANMNVVTQPKSPTNKKSSSNGYFRNDKIKPEGGESIL